MSAPSILHSPYFSLYNVKLLSAAAAVVVLEFAALGREEFVNGERDAVEQVARVIVGW
jgi:hypothetical protein